MLEPRERVEDVGLRHPSPTGYEADASSRPLLHLMQLVSPALPIGSFAYSQGLESAVQEGLVKDEADAKEWILGLLRHVLPRVEIPVLIRCHAAWRRSDLDTIERWCDWLAASREARELQAEDRALGSALARLLADLDVPDARRSLALGAMSLPAAFALAAVHWNIAPALAASGYAFAWLENQITAAIKSVPLGQTAGQRILIAGIDVIPAVVEIGLDLDDGEMGASAPGLGLLSSMHEHQYSRLFRS